MTTRASLDSYLADLRKEIDAGLVDALASLTAPDLIVEAMRYSLLSGGKRFRPCLTLAAADAAGAPLGLSSATSRAVSRPGALAVEMIHCYSLIHDDLPAMDNDTLRRGRPTSHVVHGDGLAILAGDALLTEAFRVLAGAAPPELSDATGPGVGRRASDIAAAHTARRLDAITRLAIAAGAAGMVGGQAVDLAAAGRVQGHGRRPADASALEDMHARKTGAMIRAATTIGAVLVGAPEAVVTAVDDYARDVGLAFQIIDDVLDVESTNDALGKTAGKDAAAGKPTYPARYGIEGSRQLAADCVTRARAALSRVGLDGRLGEIAEWTLKRTS